MVSFKKQLQSIRAAKTLHKIRGALRRLVRGPMTHKNTLLHFTALLLPFGASQVTLLIEPVAGVYATATAIAIYVAMAIRSESMRKTAIVAGILPVIMLINLALPQNNAFSQTVIFYDAMLVLALVYRFMFTLDQPLAQTKVGVRWYAIGLPAMAFAGQLLGLAGFALLRHSYIFQGIDWAIICGAVIIFAFAEEMLFRGLIQNLAMQYVRPRWAVILTVLLTGLVSLPIGNTLATVYAMLAAIALSITYSYKQNLLLTVSMNATAKLLYIGLIATFIL